jgi:hypothetical protein
MEEVNTTYSDPMYSEELNNTIIARGLRHNGRAIAAVVPTSNIRASVFMRCEEKNPFTFLLILSNIHFPFFWE